MPRLTSWNQLARLTRERLERLQLQTLRRFLREELPLAARFEELALRRPAPDELPVTAAADLAADPSGFVLRPTPRALRSHWPFSRKLALSLAGPRSQGLLHHTYGIVRRELDAVPGGPTFELRSTARDLDVAAEAGGRCLDVLDLVRPQARVLCALPLGSSLFWQLALAAPRAAVDCDWTGGPAAASLDEHLERLAGRTALIATPGLASVLLERAGRGAVELPELEVLVLVTRDLGAGLRARMARLAAKAGAQQIRLAQLAALPGARLALASCPVPAAEEPSGPHTFPDFLWLEERGGELLVTNIIARGSAVVRLASGLRLTGELGREPCPACGRTLTRLPAQLAPRGASELGGVLDGLDDVLAWRATAEGGLELVTRPGRLAADHVRKLVATSGLERTPIRSLNDGSEMLDWLGTAFEREERHVVGPPRT